MKRSSIVCQIALLAMIGCSGPSDTAQTAPADTQSEAVTVAAQEETADTVAASETVPGDGEAVTLVSLKVPNMH